MTTTYRKRKENWVFCAKRYSKLSVIRVASGNKRVVKMQCLCDCGNVVDVALKQLRLGKVTSCGCDHEPKNRERLNYIPLEQIKATTYGSLSVVSEGEPSGKYGRRTMNCVCICGNTRSVRLDKLKEKNKRYRIHNCGPNCTGENECF